MNKKRGLDTLQNMIFGRRSIKTLVVIYVTFNVKFEIHVIGKKKDNLKKKSRFLQPDTHL